jgi:predicted nucleic acid-binding Zn ribbon protein
MPVPWSSTECERVGISSPMATRRIRSDDERDEGPSEADLEKFGGVTRPCPECQTDLYDDAQICWKCGHALSGEPKGLPTWMMVTAFVLLLAIVLFWIL